MNIDTNAVKQEMTQMAQGAKYMCKCAQKFSPTLKNEMTFSSKCYADKYTSTPSSESFVKMRVDCSLIKAAVCAIIVMMIISAMCIIMQKMKKASDAMK